MKPLTSISGELPPLFTGITAWTGTETPASIILDKLAGEIREANEEPFDGYVTEYDGAADLASFHKSVVIGAMALIGVILTVGFIMFLWICRLHVCCHEAAEADDHFRATVHDGENPMDPLMYMNSPSPPMTPSPSAPLGLMGSYEKSNIRSNKVQRALSESLMQAQMEYDRPYSNMSHR